MKPVGHVGSLKQTHKNVDYSHLDQNDRYATTRTIDRFLNATTRRERERCGGREFNKSRWHPYNQSIMWSLLPWTTNLWDPWMREHSKSPLNIEQLWMEGEEIEQESTPHPNNNELKQRKTLRHPALLKGYKTDSWISLKYIQSLALTHTLNTEVITVECFTEFSTERSTGVCWHVCVRACVDV